METFEKSLKRLQTDYVDLYYFHYDDGKTPVAEILNTFHELVESGRVKHIAVSNITPERLKESLEYSDRYGIAKYQVFQPLYNLIEREDYETRFAPIVSEHGLTVFPYTALAGGFLTGKYRSKADLGKSPRGQGAARFMNERGMNILNALDRVAEKHNTNPAAVSIAWLMAQPNIGGPLASATSKEQLSEIIAGVSLELDSTDLDLLDKVSQYEVLTK